MVIHCKKNYLVALLGTEISQYGSALLACTSKTIPISLTQTRHTISFIVNFLREFTAVVKNKL